MLGLIKYFYFLSLRLISQFRILPLRLLGLKAPWTGLLIGGGTHWPILSLSRLKIGKNVSISSNCYFCISAENRDAAIELGDGVSISRRCSITASSGVKIGNNCRLGYNVGIIDEINLPAGTMKGKPIVIGENTFIGANSMIQPGATVESGCIIGPCCSISSNIPSDNVVGTRAQIFGDKRHLPHSK